MVLVFHKGNGRQELHHIPPFTSGPHPKVLETIFTTHPWVIKAPQKDKQHFKVILTKEMCLNTINVPCPPSLTCTLTSIFLVTLTNVLPLSVPHISLYHRPVGSESCVEHHWGLQTHRLLRHSNYLALLLLNALLTVGLRGVKYLLCHKVSWRRLNSC